MEENKTNTIEELNIDKDTDSSVQNSPVEESGVKKYKGYIIAGVIGVLVLGGFAFIPHRNKIMEENRIAMEESAAETVHNLSARKEMINSDLENFKEVVSTMDVKMVDANQKIEILTAVNNLNESIQNKDVSAKANLDKLAEIINESGAYIATSELNNYKDKFLHIVETMARMELITIDEIETVGENINSAVLIMVSNGIVYEISNMR